MKLSILIFVLTTIIYGCQCVPNPGWEEKLKQDMENLRNKLNEDQEKRNQELEAARQEREENLKQLHERLDADRQQREENLKQLHERLEAARQQREENLKQLHERLEAESQQREERLKHSRTPSDEVSDKNGYSLIINGKYSSLTTSETVNGNDVEKTVEERLFSNFKLRTITRYTPALNKTEIQYYQCGLEANSQCTLNSQILLENNQ